ncbi:MAG: SMODS domain-containing nucleotidyltransferase [Burkholderiales bacterium]|nr:MAG: hypothetical protein B7W98_00665 [Parcubacteria group bacterium 20-58-5]
MNSLFSLQSAASILYPQQQNTLAALAGLTVPAISSPPRWIAVRQRFEQFHSNLGLTQLQQLDGYTKRSGVVSCLNRVYYGAADDNANSFFIGSWGKDTAIRPPRDVDVYFVLPVNVYQRFQGYIWNRQSALLQEVKASLSTTFPNTDISGDGQVVLVNFASYNVEVVPAFTLTTPGHYWICDTNNGGSYKETAPWAEAQHITDSDTANAGNLRPLIRMLKAWQACCAVPIKSFQIELLSASFLAQSPWRHKDWFYFDWLTRDFFAFIYHRANTSIIVPGTFESIALDNAWQSRAATAYYRAVRACEYEYANRVAEAGDEWQKIFGTDVPRMP